MLAQNVEDVSCRVQSSGGEEASAPQKNFPSVHHITLGWGRGWWEWPVGSGRGWWEPELSY